MNPDELTGIEVTKVEYTIKKFNGDEAFVEGAEPVEVLNLTVDKGVVTERLKNGVPVDSFDEDTEQQITQLGANTPAEGETT